MSSDRAAQSRAFGRPDPANPQTTFVQADPSNFRTIVQKLTGAPELPLTLSPSPRPTSSRPPAGAASPVPSHPTSSSSKHGFKLHERRQRKLDTIQLGRDHRQLQRQQHYFQHGRSSPGHGHGHGHHGSSLMVSPVSPLELFGRGCSIASPGTPSVLSPKEEEEKAIAEKGFYLHPVSPLGSPPELLPLFPLESPRDQQEEDSTSVAKI
ncbi:hypothetical protein MLD38_030654 [Melastoma candidum]|uniref:Uncharacterized protein n=1 Tax=Melastoma candidum TaxID=119954 RepID=A0ACB9MMB9_9MYRT|nr:hypothetical protein MLD38_030654 [Melastoma candidum]